MTDFELGQRFDVVTCLFSAIAHLLTHERLQAAIDSMARHVNDGGLLIVEPFIRPDEWRPNHISLDQVDEQDLKVARITRSTREGDVVVMDMQFLVGTPDGIKHYREEIPARLVNDEELMQTVSSAGLDVDHDPVGLMGRGLFIGKRPAGA